MATVNQTIDVDVPVSVAYNQWTQFETFPQFMNGVDSVEQIDDTALHFVTSTAGVKREYNAQILEQVPDSLISWASTDGPRNSGVVRFEPLDPNRTRVSVTIEWEPGSFTEKAGAVLGADDLQVSADLDKFKDFIESRGQETGAWRGTISGGDVEDAGDTLEFPAVDATIGTPGAVTGDDPDLVAPTVTPGTAASDRDIDERVGDDALRKGQYAEGDYGAETLPGVPTERPEGDYTKRDREPGEGTKL